MSSGFKPPDKQELKTEYDQRVPLLKQLLDEVCYIIRKNIPRDKIAISNVEPRIKEFDDFYEKILRKEYSGDVFEQTEDIAGVRILCAYRSDLRKVETILKDKFQVVKASTMNGSSNLTLGYMSDHYIVKLPTHYSGERYDTIKPLKCEIQVRTVAMHAWATVSHQLDYKKDIDIPSELKNDFYALSGVFYIADSLFEQFKKAREKSMKELVESIQKQGFNLDDEFNLDTMEAYIRWKFPERRAGTKEVTSILLTEVETKGILDFRKLDSIINANMKWLIRSEKRDPPTTYYGKKTRYTGVGVVRVIIRYHASKS